jgi:hypothetical protein
VEQLAEEAKPQATESVIEVKELRGTSGSGYYFSATDRAPGPGGFKYMTQGQIRVGGLSLLFTILTNDGQANVVSDGLTVIADAIHRSEEAAASNQQ